MTSNWERYSRFGLNVASTATSVGFSVAKTGTKIGFAIARGVSSTVASAVGYPVGLGPVLGGAVSLAFTLAENVVLAPIQLGETITSTSLVAVETGIDILCSVFPGSDEASFSLASFVTLVKREWNDPAMRDQLPEKKYGITEIGKALVAWAALQGVTFEWKESEWFKVLREIDQDCSCDVPEIRRRTESRITITADTILPRDDGQIITADIGEAEATSSRSRTPQRSRSLQRFAIDSRLKSNLCRLSKMVLAGYGGTGLIFFGVSLSPPPSSSTGESKDHAWTAEEHILADAVNASELEAESSPTNGTSLPEQKSYSWWNVLLGKHDRDIFEGYAFTPATVREKPDRSQKGKRRAAGKPSTAIIGAEKCLPRYWVLTDHGRRQVVLVFRGTMSLNELAVDLTCDPAPFRPASSDDQPVIPMNTEEGDENEYTMPGSLPFPIMNPPPSSEFKLLDRKEHSNSAGEMYNVHGGMLRMASVMGAKGKPVHRAVRHALWKNKGYELILCGHSLGAGVAAILALTWTDPRTCLTVHSSGLPVGRKVSVYCYAPPCLVSPALSKLSQSLITSFVYSHDIVSRLSLGSVRDMMRATAWLCEANDQDLGNRNGNGEGYAAITKRILKARAGVAEIDPEWYVAIRKTLEANMHMADLFPPGRVLWAVRDGDLHTAHRLSPPEENRLRLFEVLDIEKMFGQIIFARDMLSSHLPHQYDKVLHEIL